MGAITGLFGAAVPTNRMFGAISCPPMSCAEAISKFLLPRYRPALPDLRVVISSISDEYTQLAKGLAKDFPAKVNLEPACVKLEYSLKGWPFEEEISALKLQWDAQNYGPMGVVVQTSWLLTIPVGLRAERGTLAAKRPLFNRVLHSSSVNPKWVELCQHVKGELQRNFDAMIQQGYDAIRQPAPSAGKSAPTTMRCCVRLSNSVRPRRQRGIASGQPTLAPPSFRSTTSSATTSEG